jgi:hypothetical protein
MTRLVKILILVASFLPILLAQILAFLLLSEPPGAHTWLDGHFGSLVVSLIALQLAVVVFYIWHLKKRSAIPRDQHGNWMVRFLFTRGLFAVADYWHKHIWGAPRRAP